MNNIEIATVDLSIAQKLRAIADGRKLVLLSSKVKEERELMCAITGNKNVKGCLWVEVK